jgi:hypothetical protein
MREGTASRRADVTIAGEAPAAALLQQLGQMKHLTSLWLPHWGAQAGFQADMARQLAELRQQQRQQGQRR